MKLTLLGAELEGQYLLVFRAYPACLGGKSRIKNDIFRETFEAQLNQVNIEDHGAVHTLTFDEVETWLEYEFSD